MGDAVWNSISQSFKDGLLELIILRLVNDGPSQTAKKSELTKQLAKKAGIWLSEFQVLVILKRLEKHGMLKRIPNSQIFGITAHGKEEIYDRVSQMERFIGYVMEGSP
jgi:DNA-binding PadR family transcriptional regulator